MGRLRPEFIERVDSFCDRSMDVAEALEQQGRSRRVVDQLYGSGTSVGASVAEADDGLSRKDFSTCLGRAIKELNETRYWFRIILRRGWLPPARLESLQAEAQEVKLILGSIVHKSRRGSARS